MAFNFLERLGSMFGQRVAERVMKPREQTADAEATAEAPPAEAAAEPAPVEHTATEEPAAEAHAEPTPAPVAEAAPSAEATSYAAPAEASVTEAAPASDTAAAPPEAVPEAPAEPVRSAEEIEEERLWNETDAAWASGDFAKVTELLDRLKDLQPEDAAAIDEKIAAAQYNQASALEQAGELDRALYLYQEAQRRNPNLGEASFAVERVQAALNPPAAAAEAPAEQSYTVEAGDSLWAIAERYYGDGSQFSRIFEANRDQLDNPDVIHPGQVLRIPS